MIADRSLNAPASLPPEIRSGGVVSGKFRIERVLGQGGMGVVVAATHLQLDEPVALKFLRAEAVADSEAFARFTREAKAAAKLKGEHVARVLDADVTDEGTPYIVMEYLEGRDLARTVQDSGPLHVPHAAEYLIQACEGLAEAHARGIVHRDIKPENLFLVDRAQGWKAIKILDFGISKVATPGGASNISTGSIMGSPCYMSPEQLRSTATVDHRTDIWSLGATFFELLSGKTAYDSARTLPEVIAAILENPAPRLGDVRPGLPPELGAIIARCLEKDRTRRFDNAAELALALMPFAPKRARTSVEHAVAITRAAEITIREPEAHSKSALPPTPPPSGGDTAPPAAGPTLRSRSGSDLLKPPPSVPSQVGTLGTLALPSSPAPGKGTRRSKPWWALAAAAVAAFAVLWQVAPGHRSVADAPAGPKAASAPSPTSPPAPPVVAQAPSLPAAPHANDAPVQPAASAAPLASGSIVAPSSSVGPAAASSGRPVTPRPQDPVQSPPNPQASPDLDIRMQR